jgi:hypothetical protein
MHLSVVGVKGRERYKHTRYIILHTGFKSDLSMCFCSPMSIIHAIRQNSRGSDNLPETKQTGKLN